MTAGRTLNLNLHLLDRQVVGPDDRLVCKVDDVELEPDESGRLVVTAILVGPRALGPRLGGRLGRWTAAIADRLAADRDAGPHRIDMRVVTEIGSAVRVDRTREDLAVAPLEQWVDEHVVRRIPGSRHESE
ncbi:MAG: hypothetical protein ACJ73E_14450 [Mycobacteriales bacterium]